MDLMHKVKETGPKKKKGKGKATDIRNPAFVVYQWLHHKISIQQ